MIENQQIVSDDNMIIIKGRFKSDPSNIYGELFIIFNNRKKIETSNFVLSTYSDVYNLDPNTEWNKFEEFIADLKWKGQFNKSMTASITDILNTFVEDKRDRENFFNFAYEYNYKEMDLIIFDFLNRIIHDKNLTLETSIEEISPQEYEEIKDDRSKPKETSSTKQETKMEDNSLILLVKPLLSPVKGKPIYELKINDIIIVKVQPVSDRANYFIDSNNLKIENQITPIPAKVIDIKEGETRKDPIEILTEIKAGVYGKILEDEKQVKLKTYNPAIDEKPLWQTGASEVNSTKQINNFDDEESPAISKGMLILLIFFILILGLFIGLIVISW